MEENEGGSESSVRRSDNEDLDKQLANLSLQKHASLNSSEEHYDSSEYSSDDNHDHQLVTKKEMVSNLAHDYKSRYSDVNTDSSDIEVLIDDKNNSSDSFEVLEPSDKGNCSSQWVSNLNRQDTVVEQTGGKEGMDISENSDNVTECCAVDTLSDSATILSSSSALTTDESKNSSPSLTKPGGSRASHLASDHTSPPSSSNNSPVHLPSKDAEDDFANFHRPDSLVLPKPLQYYERQRLAKKESISSQSSRSSSMDALLETPLSMQGTITKEGDMMSFVAEGLTDMIKRSSPMSRSRTESSVSSWSVGPSGPQTPSARSVSSLSSSTSGWDSSASSVTGYSYSGLSRSKRKKLKAFEKTLMSPFSPRSASELTQSPDDIPPIDPRALMDLELHAQKTAESLNHMMSTLSTNLHKMSALTYSCLGAYAEGVDNTCDAVDSSIKSMYALMAKCEELSTAMRPIYAIQDQIKDIKRLLDLFEAQMNKTERS